VTRRSKGWRSIEAFTGAVDHLRAELGRLDILLRRRIEQMRAARTLAADPELGGLYVSDTHADALLAAAEPDDGGSGEQLQRLREENERRAAAAGARLPLVELRSRFGLDAFEADVLLVALAPEVDLRYEALYAYAQNDVTLRRPSVDLTLRLLCSGFEDRLDRRRALVYGAPLRRHGLVEVVEPDGRDSPFPARVLKLDDRIVDFALGGGAPDARLLAFSEHVQPQRDLDELALPAELRARLANAGEKLPAGRLLLFTGPEGVGKRAVAEALCVRHGLGLLALDLRAALAAGAPLAATLALIRREARLTRSAVYLDHFEALLADPTAEAARTAAVARMLAELEAAAFAGSELEWRPGLLPLPRGFLSFAVPLPHHRERQRLWEQALRNGRPADVAAVAAKFALGPGPIEAAAREAADLATTRDASERAVSGADLHAAARSQSHGGLARLARRIEPRFGWDDIVLPAGLHAQLRELCSSVRHRHVVYSDWGFDRKLSLGKGLHVLFTGPSGTGKTMAAGIVAGELGLDLYKVDLSTVVSKYIGETERHLREIFLAAEASNAILFLDECDALLGKRSEVKDAHDRYANIEVAYLLQKLEEHEGPVILATNFVENVDDAFVRRMHHVLEFPALDARLRERVWRQMFPRQTPVSPEVDFGFLAERLEFTGGNIRNVAVAAAFLAAEEGGEVTMEHLVRGAAREFQKLGRLPSKADFGDYYELALGAP
jgi:ATPase family associated with various cellular activities (AAA)